MIGHRDSDKLIVISNIYYMINCMREYVCCDFKSLKYIN